MKKTRVREFREPTGQVKPPGESLPPQQTGWDITCVFHGHSFSYIYITGAGLASSIPVGYNIEVYPILRLPLSMRNCGYYSKNPCPFRNCTFHNEVLH